MAHKSDNRGERHISATEASRSFSSLLDEIDAGARYLIHRRGRNICLMAPTPPVSGRRASECLALLRGRSQVLLDDRFSSDMDRIISGEVTQDPRWDS